MISYLKGKILKKGNGFIILEVNNIGYQVFVNPTMYADLSIGTESEFYTHQYVREDSLDLYGFRNMEELELFELLLSISGVGPKSALGVLAIAKVEDIKDSIARGDSSLLTKVSGIGKKTAERVVLELKEKVGSLAQGSEGVPVSAGGHASDEIDALMALGYSASQAREALQKVAADVKDSSERIRQALKNI